MLHASFQPEPYATLYILSFETLSAEGAIREVKNLKSSISLDMPSSSTNVP